MNCLAPHPLKIPILATSGIESDIKIWSPGHDESSSLLSKKDTIIKTNKEEPLTNPALIDLFENMERREGRITREMLQQMLSRETNEGEEECTLM